LKSRYGVLHGIVHSVAFAPTEELKGEFLSTTREGFRIAHDIQRVLARRGGARGAAPLMTSGGGIVTMTYYGAEKVVPKYNVMGVAQAALEASVRYLAYDLGPKGVRVNAISAGPIKTLAARAVAGLGDMLKAHADRAPLKRNVDPAEVGEPPPSCFPTRVPASRRNDLRRLRLQHHGFLTSLESNHAAH